MSRQLGAIATVCAPRTGGTSMRMLVALALALLVLPGTALWAAPPTDNRANAEPIPAFPHTLSATTAEATVERLDPQVSRCGRIEAALWYPRRPHPPAPAG